MLQVKGGAHKIWELEGVLEITSASFYRQGDRGSQKLKCLVPDHIVSEWGRAGAGPLAVDTHSDLLPSHDGQQWHWEGSV